MGTKDHYRLYKSGKRWLAALIMLASTGVVVAANPPTAQAAAPTKTPAVTATEQTNLQKNVAALQAALKQNNWGALTVEGQTLTALAAKAKDTDSLETAWQAAAQVISAQALQNGLGLADMTSAHSQTVVTDFLDAQSTVTDDARQTNGQALQSIVAQGIPSQAEPLVDYAAVLAKVTDYLTQATKTPVPEQQNWQINQASLAKFLTDNQLGGLFVPGSTTTTLTAELQQVKDDQSLSAAWASIAQAISLNTMQKDLQLKDITSAASQSALTTFLNTESKTQAGKSNAAVFQEIVSTGTPNSANPTPNFVNTLANLVTAIDDAAKTPVPADWQVNQASLAKFLTDNKLGGLMVPDSTTTLADAVKNVKDDQSLSTAWTAVAESISLHEMQKVLDLPDTTSDTSKTTLTDFLAAQSKAENHTTDTNEAVFQSIVDGGMPSEKNPTPNFANTLADLAAAIDEAANTPVQADWQINQAALLRFLQDNQLTELTVPGESITLGDAVKQVKDDQSLSDVWTSAAQAISLHTMQTALHLTDTTAAANRAVLTQFLNTASTVASHTGDTNAIVFQDIVAGGTPGQKNPTPNFANTLASLITAIEDAAKTPVQADWQVNQASLAKFLTDNKLGVLFVPGSTTNTLADAVAKVTDTKSFDAAWTSVAQAVSLKEMQTALKLTDTTSAANQQALTNFLSTLSTIAGHTDETNAVVFQDILKDGTPSVDNPTPNFANTLADLIDAIDQAAKTPVQANWEINRDALLKFLQDNKLTDLKEPKKDTTLVALLQQVTDDKSVNTAWQLVAQAVSLKEMAHALNLPDVTSDASESKLNNFLNALSTVEGHTQETNAIVFQGIVNGGTPSEKNPTPNFANTLADLTAAIDQAAQTPVPANWEINKAALLKFLQDNKLTDLPASAQGGKLIDVIEKVSDDASFNQAWANTAMVVATEEARQKLGLSDLTSPANQKILQAILDAKSTDAKYLGQTNSAALTQLIMAGTPDAEHPTPNLVNTLALITNYMDNAVQAQQSTIVVEDWFDGIKLGTHKLPVVSGQAVTVTANAHSGLVLSYVTVDGVTQATTNGQFVFSRDTIKPGSTVTVKYYYVSANQGGGGGTTPTTPTTPSTPLQPSTPVTPTINAQAARGSVYVKTADGAVLYSDMAMTKPISGRTLDYATAWAYFAKVYDAKGNLIGYNLGGSQFVKLGDVQEAPVDKVTIESFNGNVQIVGMPAQVYSDAAMTKPISGQTLSVGTQWRTYQKVYHDGILAGYNLGGQQFIASDRAATDGVIPKRGVFTVRYPENPQWGVAVYDGQRHPIKIISAGTRWQVYGMKKFSDGFTYYNLGGDQWVPASYGKLN